MCNDKCTNVDSQRIQWFDWFCGKTYTGSVFDFRQRHASMNNPRWNSMAQLAIRSLDCSDCCIRSIWWQYLNRWRCVIFFSFDKSMGRNETNSKKKIPTHAFYLRFIKSIEKNTHIDSCVEIKYLNHKCPKERNTLPKTKTMTYTQKIIVYTHTNVLTE